MLQKDFSIKSHIDEINGLKSHILHQGKYVNSLEREMTKLKQMKNSFRLTFENCSNEERKIEFDDLYRWDSDKSLKTISPRNAQADDQNLNNKDVDVQEGKHKIVDVEGCDDGSTVLSMIADEEEDCATDDDSQNDCDKASDVSSAIADDHDNCDDSSEVSSKIVDKDGHTATNFVDDDDGDEGSDVLSTSADNIVVRSQIEEKVEESATDLGGHDNCYDGSDERDNGDDRSVISSKIEEKVQDSANNDADHANFADDRSSCGEIGDHSSKIADEVKDSATNNCNKDIRDDRSVADKVEDSAANNVKDDRDDRSDVSSYLVNEESTDNVHDAQGSLQAIENCEGDELKEDLLDTKEQSPPTMSLREDLLDTKEQLPPTISSVQEKPCTKNKRNKRKSTADPPEAPVRKSLRIENKRRARLMNCFKLD